MKPYTYIPLVVLPLLSFVLLNQKSLLVSAQVAPPPLPPFSCPACILGHVGNRLKNTDMSDAYLRDARFENNESLPIKLNGVILNGAALDRTTFDANVILDNATIKNATMDNLQMSSVHATNVNFKNSKITSAMIQNTNLQGCNFSNANLQETQFNDSDFTGSNMTGITALDTDFTGTNLTNVNFSESNLQGAISMSTATVTGAIWANTTCPDGTNSDANGGTCVGHF